MSYDSSAEAEIYGRLSSLEVSTRSGEREGLRTTPLVTLAVKNAANISSKSCRAQAKSRVGAEESKIFNQYAVLGFHAGFHEAIRENEPILMNVDAPNSTFICGSQGSGKSYTLSCMLEDCLIADDRIGRVKSPVAGVAFHYDLNSTGSVAESAYLCSMGVHVNVLVSQSNERVLRTAYSRLPNAADCLTVTPLLFAPQDLSIERMHRLMAFADKGATMPLYMSVALRILRQMAVNTGGTGFSYLKFKQALKRENLTKDQVGPLNLRLELLESFLNNSKEVSRSLLSLEPGTLTIIDLSDPFMDPATACILFEICLGLIEENRPSCGLVVALDEAHKYMTTSLAAANFTERLLGTIREQRHNGTRVIIATQEPTISEKLLDLCSVSIIHRFTSPAWFVSLCNHLGAASRLVSSDEQQDAMFEEIMALKVGESLLFSPSAYLCFMEPGNVSKLGKTAITIKTRTRLGDDGGMSVLASTQDNSSVHIPTASEDRLTSSTESNGFRGEPSAMPQVRESRTSLSENRVNGATQGGVSIVHENRHQTREGIVSILSRVKSHLALICCMCKKIAIVEFHGQFPPQCDKSEQKSIKNGIGYATCVRCRLKVIPETIQDSNRFDGVKSVELNSGRIDVDEDLCRNLAASLSIVLATDVAVIRRERHPMYVPAKTVQQNLKCGGSIWSAVLQSGGPAIKLTKHKDGIFFKSSLQPK